MTSLQEPDAPALVVFCAAAGLHPVEQMLTAAHRAVTLDLLERAESAGSFSELIVASNDDALLDSLPSCAKPILTSEPFHFGETLHKIIGERGLRRPFYVGGGSCPLLQTEEIETVAAQLAASDQVVIANNIFSSDLVAFTPGSAIGSISLPARDNPLAQALRLEAGLPTVELPRTAATQMDVDSPLDLAILSLHPGIGPRTKHLLTSLALDTERLRSASRVFTDGDGLLLVAGRVSSHVWSYLETQTACRVRLFAEERGMEAEGRVEQGKVRSLLGLHLQETGVKRFFEHLADLGQAAFLDSRVIFNHLRLNVSRPDRFLSDLGQVAEIEHQWVKEFTAAALEAPIPVVLGGHSLVSGGIMAMIEAAWLERDAATGRVDETGQPTYTDR